MMDDVMQSLSEALELLAATKAAESELKALPKDSTLRAFIRLMNKMLEEGQKRNTTRLEEIRAMQATHQEALEELQASYAELQLQLTPAQTAAVQ